jgi:glycosyltransferase involved in cell wall biosynthesis
VTVAGDRIVHLLVPDGLDDPQRTSGGNVFDRHLATGLMDRGWDVRMTEADAAPAVETALAALPAGALVVIDGLVAGWAPAAVETAAQHLTVVVLAHMVRAAFPDADSKDVEGERRALTAAHRVIATSEWTREELIDHEQIPAQRITVAVPGTAAAAAAQGTPGGGALLCVGVIAPHKGQDVLVEALRMLDADVAWTCTIAGSLTAHPGYAGDVSARAAGAGLRDRVRMPGPLAGEELDAAYRKADLVVAPSRVESYGMAVADALARGIPVVASTAGGLPQTVAGSGAALLVPPGEPAALSAALQRWMIDPRLHSRLKDEAMRTRSTLPRWGDTVDRVEDTLRRLL